MEKYKKEKKKKKTGTEVQAHTQGQSAAFGVSGRSSEDQAFQK